MHNFSPELLLACKKAISENISNDEQFIDFIVHQFGYRCPLTLVEHIHLDESAPDRAKRNRDIFTKIETTLRVSTRGSYYLVEKKHPERSTVFQIVFAYGNGEVSFGGTLDIESSIPTEETIEKRIVAFEIFECKKYCKVQSILMRSRQAIRECELKIGQVFQDVQLPSIGVPVTVTIKHVDFGNGHLRLFVKPKKGIGKTIDLPAYHFSVCANLRTAAQFTKLQSETQPQYTLAS